MTSCKLYENVYKEEKLDYLKKLIDEPPVASLSPLPPFLPFPLAPSPYLPCSASPSHPQHPFSRFYLHVLEGEYVEMK